MFKTKSSIKSFTAVYIVWTYDALECLFCSANTGAKHRSMDGTKITFSLFLLPSAVGENTLVASESQKIIGIPSQIHRHAFKILNLTSDHDAAGGTKFDLHNNTRYNWNFFFLFITLYLIFLFPFERSQTFFIFFFQHRLRKPLIFPVPARIIIRFHPPQPR